MGGGGWSDAAIQSLALALYPEAGVAAAAKREVSLCQGRGPPLAARGRQLILRPCREEEEERAEGEEGEEGRERETQEVDGPEEPV